jgi:DNA/RNA endonuclease YhcR with UshA esterase domain
LVATARYHCTQPERPTFLNFDQPYPNQTFAVMIPDASRAAFSSPPEELFNGKTVCVTGLIVDRRGKPQIVVEDPGQIVIQEAVPATASEAVTKVITNTNQKTPTTAIEPVTNTSQKPLASVPPSATLKGVPSAQAQQHIGETNTVCGLVATARYHGTQPARPTFLNFDHPYPNQTFAVMIPDASRAKFKSPPETLFNGKTVCVTGLIVDRRGRPQIVVEDSGQIVIQEAAPATASEAVPKAITNTNQKTPTTAIEPVTNTSQKTRVTAPPP